MNLPKILSVAAAVSIFTACASKPEKNDDYTQLESQYNKLANSEDVGRYAPVALAQVEEDIEKIASMIKDGDDKDKIQHHMEVAETKLAIVEQKVRKGRAQNTIDQAALNRKDVLLSSERRQSSELKSQNQELKSQYEQAMGRAELLEDRAKKLESEVESIKVEKNEEGLVLVLSDILFDFNEASLRAGNEATLRKIGDLLQDHPDSQIVVNGHTDAIGPESYNRDLSKRRAESVKEVLVRVGVNDSRIDTEGLGESRPVATNETKGGRLQNRRVEIIIKNEEQISAAE